MLVRAVPAALLFGTTDVRIWETLAPLPLIGENFYATGLHNWPALWIYLLAGLWLVHDATGLPFAFLVKLPPIGADACIAILVHRAGLHQRWGPRRAALTGLAYALHPVSVLISGYHGQFDSLMIAPAFLAWYGWEFWAGRRRLLGSALALGLGIWFKAVPLVLLPIFLLRLASRRERLIYGALAIAPAGLGTLPYLLLWPSDVTRTFFGYTSWFGQWGYPLVWMLIEFLQQGSVPAPAPHPDYVSSPLRLMFLLGRWLLLVALGVTWWYTCRRGFGALPSILTTFTVFYFAAGGFGLQYLAWIVPFALAARDRWVWPYTAAATVALLAAYVAGPDAYLPPSIAWPPMQPYMREFIAKLASIPTWLICGLWALALLRRKRQGRRVDPT